MKDQELLELCNKYLIYNPETGIIVNKIDRSTKARIGRESGCIGNGGYRRIKLRDKSYRAHRLAYLMTYEYLPEFIDHINQNKIDNRIINLRSCTKQENSMNRRSNKNTSSKYKGVSWHKNAKKWMAKIKIDSKAKHLGYFQTESDAAKAYDKAALEHFGEFACLNNV